MIDRHGHAEAARCVVLGRHDAPAAGALDRAITDAGYGEVVRVDRWLDLLRQVVELDPHAVVLDLAMVGRAGIRLIAAVRALSPRSRLAVVSELGGTDLASLEAGADVVVDPRDLRPLTIALRGPADAAVQA